MTDEIAAGPGPESGRAIFSENVKYDFSTPSSYKFQIY